MQKYKHKKSYPSLAVATLLLAGAAQAQIDEIIVTANKREQTLQEVPISVSVTSEEVIQQSSIVDLIDLQTAVPALRVNQLQNSSQTNFVIRGFGNGANNPGIEPAVLVLIDGVPRSRSSSSLADLPTLERVEVLSGPQSMLFGKNASAGVISITTKAPENELAGLVESTLGNYGAQTLKGTVTGPINDDLSFRLSASSNSRDGLGTNLSNNSKVNDRDRYAFRGQLLWEPSDLLSIRLIADQDKVDEACCVTGQLLKGDAATVVDGIAKTAGRGSTDADPWDREVYMNFNPYNKLDNEGVSLHVEYDLRFATLTSITADRSTSMHSNFDADFTAAKLVKENQLDYTFETFTQELRLASNGDSDIQWTLGAFYADESTDTNRTVIFGEELNGYMDKLIQSLTEGNSSLSGIAKLYNDNASDYFKADTGSLGEGFVMQTETLSVFANVDFQLTDRLLVTAGLNYTDDKKTVRTDVKVVDEFGALSLPLPPNPLADLAGFQFFKPFTNYGNPGDAENGIFDSDDLTHTLRLTYDIHNNTKAYISHSTGFKPISVNLSVDASNAAVGRAADPEESSNIELGVKHSYDNGYVNLALFKQKIEGFQSNTFTGNGFSLVNAGEQEHQGIELDMVAALTDAMVVGLSAVQIDAEYVSFVNGSCDTIGLGGNFASLACDAGKKTRDLSGTTPGGVHDWSINANGTYSFDVNDAISGFLRLEYVYENNVALVDNVPKSLASRNSKNINLSLGLSNEPSGVETMLWVRNLTDHESLISAFPTTATPGSFGGYPNMPRTYGLTLRANF